MSRADKERQQRLQRMLAREQGIAPPDERLSQQARSPADVPPDGFVAPPQPSAGQTGTAPAAAPAAVKPDAAKPDAPAAAAAQPDVPGQASRPADPAPAGAGAQGSPALSGFGNLHRVDFSRSDAEARRRARKKRRPLSPVLLRRRKRRRNLVIALILALALLFAWVSGALSAAVMMAGDAAEGVRVSFEPGSWPAVTGISNPLQVEELDGGFVELGSSDVAVFSANGATLRTIQPGYARPAIAVGGSRFVLYNRAANEMRVESRTRTISVQTLDAGILLCAMSENGTTAAVTESTRYAACVDVFDPLGENIYQWYATQTDGTPVALAFARDNHRFAAGCVSADQGQILTKVFLMDTASSSITATYTAQPGEMILKLAWLGSSRVLAVMSDCALLLDAGSGAELARYDFGGASLLDLDLTDGGEVALLLSGRANATLTLLGSGLNPLLSVDAGAAGQLCCTDTQIYLTGGSWVRCLDYEGTLEWEKTLESPAVAVLDAAQPLLFTGTGVQVLSR